MSLFSTMTTFGAFVRRAAVLLALTLACLASACAPSMTQRIKVTVTVEDNGVRHVASAVQEWTCTATDNRFHGMAIGGCSLRAEAIPIKIGDKGWAFMLLSGSEEAGFNPEYYPSAIQAGRPKSAPRDRWMVRLDDGPMFVRFRDLRDRMTIEQVKFDQFDKAFGQGVSIVSVECEVTNEKLTRNKIKKLLPWITKIDWYNESLPSDPSNVATQVSVENFVWRL